MDLFEGQADPDHQVHDYNPGIPKSGLFWIMAIPQSAQIDPQRASASLSLSRVAIGDFHDLVSALHGGPAVPATVSFDVQWSGVRRRYQIRDFENDFAGRFIEGRAAIKWSAEQEGFRFASDPNSGTNVFSVIGRERNGAFLEEPEDNVNEP